MVHDDRLSISFLDVAHGQRNIIKIEMPEAVASVGDWISLAPRDYARWLGEEPEFAIVALTLSSIVVGAALRE
jgi:hypothetical protein